ncbi:MAG: acyl transferase [Flavisolibacter sp.]
MRVEIPKSNTLEQQVFNIHNENDFSSIALEVYQFQFSFNPIYQSYCEAVGRTPAEVHHVNDIPFLPISFFKTHRVTTTSFEPELIFKSSGTTASATSSHYIKSSGLYRESFTRCFELFYGRPEDLCIIGLLPSYLEQGNSSLIYMVDHLIRRSVDPASGFYLNDFKGLSHKLQSLEAAGRKTLLIGVTYALLDFASAFPCRLQNTIVMETGGMKGRKREMVKKEMYADLKESFGLNEIHGEYGMTELLSQAYGKEGQYLTPPWMRILLRDETDPFLVYPVEKNTSGGINIIDLANLYSCSFIATGDVGKREEHHIEVMGRLDHSDIRGCSLLTT